MKWKPSKPSSCTFEIGSTRMNVEMSPETPRAFWEVALTFEGPHPVVGNALDRTMREQAMREGKTYLDSLNEVAGQDVEFTFQFRSDALIEFEFWIP